MVKCPLCVNARLELIYYALVITDQRLTTAITDEENTPLAQVYRNKKILSVLYQRIHPPKSMPLS